MLPSPDSDQITFPNQLPLRKFPKNMKKLGFLGLLALVACQNNPQEESANGESRNFPIYQQIETEVNSTVVYGVLVQDSSAERSNRAYEVTFKLGDKVWLDTLILELPGKEMVQGELIFGEAVVDDMGGANFEVKSIEIE